MVVMGVAAPHVVLLLYGPQWTGVVAPLQVLCCAGYFRALYHVGGVVSQSAGYVYSELRRQLLYAVLVVGGTLVGLRYGLVGVAVGVAIAICVMFFATAQLCLRITQSSWSQYARAQGAALATAVACLIASVSSRSFLEAQGVPSAATALGILLAVAVPWGTGLAWTVASPGFEHVRGSLPQGLQRLLLAFGRLTSVAP
jgi:PST family polysaccharide transporter